MKSMSLTFGLAVCWLVLPGAAPAQADDSANAQIDEIVVEEQMSLSKLRRQVWQYEEDFYAIYNELNDDREFDVNCFFETPTGSHIKNHVCRARFVTNAYSNNAAKQRWSARREGQQAANPEIVEKTAEFERIMSTLVAESPELQAALARYNTARAQFMARIESEEDND
ncbi:MAG: hypothetical protein R3315_12105 [Woeseiaceae bacterium]|nr:hypothetical protein [Woeseiaceae bacterium]